MLFQTTGVACANIPSIIQSANKNCATRFLQRFQQRCHYFGEISDWRSGHLGSRFPQSGSAVLNAFNSFILANFANWYIWVVATFVIVCIGLAVWPTAGRLKLGKADEVPEFSNFSWFSMMFGAGIGVGMLTWAVAEPVYHFNNNPEVIQGLATAAGEDNVRNAYKWSFLHWGLGAWACYAIAGLALAFFSYRRGLPLTIRSSLTPLFGKSLSGPLGHVIDIVAVVATILGVPVTS